ncbi:MAG: DUF1893 domain-containing protein [Dehalococcoidales bacterium]|nr:DUF1893 domain-containing protein [Dehalococcoidales bacterium]
MIQHLFDEFIASSDTLRVFAGGQLVFASARERLLPMMEYLSTLAPHHRDVVILDKVMGNAAALLAARAHCREVYSPLGSELAVKTLDACGIKHNITETVPYILKPDGSEMCPMEKLSIGKNPDEFYRALKSKISPAR